MKKLKIMGIDLAMAKKYDLWQQITIFLKDKQQHLVFTPNAEIILAAQHDDDYFHILNKADLNLPDAIALKFAAWTLGKNLNRYTGSDLTKDLLKYSQEQKLKILIINKYQGLSSESDILHALSEKYPTLEIRVLTIKTDSSDFDATKLNNFEPDIIFCALGAPYQEKFLFYNLSKIPSAKIGIGIGGSFDFLTNKIKRAPKLMRQLGFEWLWRLIQQPTRIKRIYNAVIKFPIHFNIYHFWKRLFYRANVVGFLYNQNNEVLFVSNITDVDKDYWGLPQGGRDAYETDEEAIKRELLEEAGTNNFEIIKKFPNIFKYKWPKSFTNQGYKGQRQALFILKYLGDGSDIKINPLEHRGYKWVKIDDMLNQTPQVRLRAYEKFLKKYYSLNK